MKGAYTVEELREKPYVFIQQILASEAAEIKVENVRREQAAAQQKALRH